MYLCGDGLNCKPAVTYVPVYVPSMSNPEEYAARLEWLAAAREYRETYYEDRLAQRAAWHYEQAALRAWDPTNRTDTP